MKVPTHTVIIGGQMFNMVKTADHEAALQAETTRRLEAEVIADWIIRRPDIYGGTDALDLSQEYRAKYPKEPKQP